MKYYYIHIHMNIYLYFSLQLLQCFLKVSPYMIKQLYINWGHPERGNLIWLLNQISQWVCMFYNWYGLPQTTMGGACIVQVSFVVWESRLSEQAVKSKQINTAPAWSQLQFLPQLSSVMGATAWNKRFISWGCFWSML